MEEMKKGINQWKFVHGLLKSMVMNTIVSMVYVRQTPDGDVYIKKASDIKSELVKRCYIALNKSLEMVEGKYGFNGGRKTQIITAMQMLCTIADNDHVYRELATTFASKLMNMTESEMKEFEDAEGQMNVPKHTFKKRGENGRE